VAAQDSPLHASTFWRPRATRRDDDFFEGIHAQDPRDSPSVFAGGTEIPTDRPQLQHHPRHRRQIFEVAKQTGLGWPLPKELADDETLIARLFPDSVSAPSRPGRTKPASAAVRTSMVQSSAAR